MDRVYLGNYLAGQYAPLIAAAGVTSGDLTAGYGPALDSVMRLLALDPATTNPTIPTSQESDALLLTRYYALSWLLQAFAASADFSTPEVKDAGSQRFKQVQMLRDQALAQVPSQYPVESGDFAFGRIQLDILEPSAYLAGGPPFPYW